MEEDGWTCSQLYPGYGGTGFDPCGDGPFCTNCWGTHLEFEHGFGPESRIVEAPPDLDEEEP
jgi:hypothetical protein